MLRGAPAPGSRVCVWEVSSLGHLVVCWSRCWDGRGDRAVVIFLALGPSPFSYPPVPGRGLVPVGSAIGELGTMELLWCHQNALTPRTDPPRELASGIPQILLPAWL